MQLKPQQYVLLALLIKVYYKKNWNITNIYNDSVSMEIFGCRLLSATNRNREHVVAVIYMTLAMFYKSKARKRVYFVSTKVRFIRDAYCRVWAVSVLRFIDQKAVCWVFVLLFYLFNGITLYTLTYCTQQVCMCTIYKKYF